MDIDPKQRQSVPFLGVLSRTLIRSPIIKWILPASLHRKKRHEVVMVGEDLFHVKQLRNNKPPRHIGTKSDLGSKIRAAAVIGESPKQSVHSPQPRADESSEDEEDFLGPSLPPQFLVLAMEDPPELRFLISDCQNRNGLAFHERIQAIPVFGELHTTPGHLIAVDPNSRAIAVAAPSKNVLVFRLRNLQQLQEQYLDDDRRQFWNPVLEGHMLSVDGTILRMDFLTLGSEYFESIALILVVGKGNRSRIFRYIWNFAEEPLRAKAPLVEPLEPTFGFPQLLIPTQHSPSFLLVYQKEYMIVKDGMSSSLTFSNPIKFLHSFQQDPRFPGTSRCPPLWTAWSRPLRSREWYDNELEAFHVVREDGLVYYFHAEKGKTTELGRMAMFTGFVDQAFACCDVDTTLMKPFLLIAAGESSPGEVLSIGASRVDRLIAMAPQNLEVIHNWSPTLDMMISDLGHRSGPGSLHHRTAIYCTAMMGPEHGAVAEMNLGLEARPKVISEGEGFSGVTRIWALLVPSAPPERRESVALVLSMIEETAIIQLKPSTDPDQPYEQDESFDEDNCGLAFDRPTLAVAHLSGARMIQVTNESIQILHNTGSSPKQFSEVTFASSRPQNITCASVSEDAGTVLVALRVDPNFILRLVQIDVTRTLGSQENDNSIGEPFHLDSEPTAMAIFKVCATVHAVASTADGNLHILRRGERDTLLSCVKYSMARSEHASSPTICESLTVLHRSVGIDSDQLDSTCELVCGMRDGTILIVSLAPTISSRSLNDTAAVNGHDSDPISALSDIVVLGERWITLGITPVMVIPERPSKRNAAFAFCGRHLFRLTLPIDNAEDFHIDEVVSNHWGTPIPRNTPVSAVTPILNPLGLKHVSRDDIAMMCGSTLSLSTINLDRKPVPTLLRLRGQGTPNRLLYLDSLDCIAVASMRTKVLITHPPNQAWAGKRITRAQIEFVSTNLFDEDDKPLVLCTHKLSPGERILCMVDWKIIVSGKKYHYLLVGAELKDKDQNQTGLLRFLNMRRVKEDDMTRLDVNQSKQIQSSAPIYSIATLGETDIVFATGFWLKVLRFDSATKRWASLCTYELRSTGLHITTSRPYIYVSTAADSLMVFELAESRTNDSNAHLEPVLADSQARDSLHHLTLNCALPRATSTLESQRSDPDAMQIDSPRPSSSFSLHPNLILISDKTSSTAGTITGLFCTPHRTNQLAAPTLFEAHLPRRVMRLRNGLVRPSWRRLPATPNGVVADDIVGTTTDGHVYAFSLLDRHALAVLKTLEDAVKSEQAVRLKRYGGLDSAERDKVTIRMGSGARNGNWAFEYDDEDLSHRAVGMRRGEGGPEARHVDGDVLEPLLARGGEEKMLTLLEMDEERGGMSEEKYEDFVQIAGTVLGVEEETLMDKSRLSKELIRWLKMVLAPIL